MTLAKKIFQNSRFIPLYNRLIAMNKTVSIIDSIKKHISKSMSKALASERFPLWKLTCAKQPDVEFVLHGILRCFSPVKSGRHYLQCTDETQDVQAHSSYFNRLKSRRRRDMMEALEKQSYTLFCGLLSALGIDYLRQFPELDDFQVEAVDGHFIQHACHTPKNEAGKVFAAGAIYGLNLRNGLLRGLYHITNGTIRHHELPRFREMTDAKNKKNRGKKKQKMCFIYDKAIIDWAWWEKQKRHQNFMISVLKENDASTFVEVIPFDQNEPINIGVEAYSVYKNGKATFHVIDYRDPETGILRRFISTMPETINPGLIAFLYFKRWTIEKSFNNNKSDLNEQKAWSPHVNSQHNQMRFIGMAYNFARFFEEQSKAENPALIHPSDKKYNQALKKRQVIAKEKGLFVNSLHFLQRITRVASFSFRLLQYSIIMRKSLIHVVRKLKANLVRRGRLTVEH